MIACGGDGVCAASAGDPRHHFGRFVTKCHAGGRRSANLHPVTESPARTSRPLSLEVDGANNVRLGDLHLFTEDFAALLTRFEQFLATEHPALVVTTNANQVVDLSRRADSRAAYDVADLIVIDGMPLVFLAKALGATDVHRHAGADLLPQITAASVHRGWRVAIVGGRDGVAQRAAEALRATNPGVELAPVEFPMLTSTADPASDAPINVLTALRPDVVFLCLGAPKQELWFRHWRQHLPPAVYIGAGAAVDFAAEEVRRAPGFVQRIGAEWLWRLAQEPRRLARRYLLEGPRFLGVIVRSWRHRREHRP